ncbi:MAG: S41 family peptidase [Verrucomicrobiota bacterium]
MNARCPVRFLFACGWAVVSVSAAIPEAASPVRMVGWPALSPDGETVVFEWLDDLWRVPVEGGEVIRLTQHLGQASRPHFTPDGQRVVFTSRRSGSLQVFSMAANGGEPIQHSFHSEGGWLECLTPDGKHAIISGIREHAGPHASRLLEVDLTGERRERQLFDAYATTAACAPDGTRMLVGRWGDKPYRKGDAGARAAQLWLYDGAGQSFERMLPDAMDVRSPVWHRDGKGFYYVSSINGVANLCSYREASQSSKQLTFSAAAGVSQPSVSADESTIILQLGWQLCRFRPATDAAPVPLELWTHAKLPDISRLIEPVDATPDADFSPGLDQVVFSALGELWWMADGKSPPTRLTETPAAESDVRFSPAGGWLIFLRDDGLEANYFRAKLDNGHLGVAHQITHGSRSKCRMKVSPDGTQIAWVEGTGDVFTAAADGSNPTRVFPCWDMPAFDWSPCGRWLALAAIDKNHNRDIWLAAADGSRKPLNLTRLPAVEGSPRWSPDGRFLVFTARSGGPNDNSLWRIDFGKGGLAADLSDAAISRLGERAAPLSTRGLAPSRVIWAADSMSLLVQSADASDPRLYSLSISSNVLTPVAQHRGEPIRMTADGALLWRVDGCPAILKNGELTRFPIAMTVERRREDVLRLGFRRIWRTLGERFYDPAMKGADWPALREKYEALAVAAQDSSQFDRVVAMLLGELNASHLEFVSRGWPPPVAPAHPVEATAHPGLVFVDDAGDGPLVVARVLAGSPVAQLKEAPQPREIVTRLAGHDVDSHTSLQPFFEGALDRPLPLVVRGADGRQRVLELRCIAYARARALDRESRATACRMLAADPQSPRIAYLPFPDMSRQSIQQLELGIYRASLDHDGLILDLRDNGGGNAADQVLAMFCQPSHAFTIPRDGPAGYPAERRGHPVWDHPLVVLCNENTCSNAEIFCRAIQQTGRAPLIGSPTAGCVITAVDEPIPDLGKLQIPFRGWFDATTGTDLEMLGAVPLFPVAFGPADEAAGRDPQLARALEIMRETLAKAPAPVEARWR